MRYSGRNVTREDEGQAGPAHHNQSEEGFEAKEDERTESIIGSHSSNSTQRSGDDILNDRAAVSGASRMNKTPHTIASESRDYTVPHVGSFRRHCNVCKQPYPALHSFYHQVSSYALSYLIMPCHTIPRLAMSCCFPCLALPYLALPCLALPCLALPCLCLAFALPCLA